MDCKTCKENRLPENVPYLSHEAEMARAERTQKRLWITVLLLIVLLVASNAGWMYYENQFEDVVTTSYEADASDGGNAVANGEWSVTINGQG